MEFDKPKSTKEICECHIKLTSKDKKMPKEMIKIYEEFPKAVSLELLDKEGLNLRKHISLKRMFRRVVFIMQELINTYDNEVRDTWIRDNIQTVIDEMKRPGHEMYKEFKISREELEGFRREEVLEWIKRLLNLIPEKIEVGIKIFNGSEMYFERVDKQPLDTFGFFISTENIYMLFSEAYMSKRNNKVSSKPDREPNDSEETAPSVSSDVNNRVLEEDKNPGNYADTSNVEDKICNFCKTVIEHALDMDDKKGGRIHVKCYYDRESQSTRKS